MSEEIINKLFSNKIKQFIFIYTPPKVGSTTLVSSLRISLSNLFNVIHIHDDIMLNVLTGITNITVNEIINYLSHQDNIIYVIDVYRTPIERKISEFFEKISPYHFNNTEENINKYSIKRLSDRFNKLFPHLAIGDHYFDKYNIEKPVVFDFKKKYTIQEINNIKYIKLRLCDSKIWGLILSEIFKKEIILINDYQTNEKEISELYKKFKKEYKIPLNFFELIKNCNYLKFYFSEEERNQYLHKWSEIITDNFVPYTKEEYNFYVNLYLENQYINDIQLEHYIDNGCLCNFCTKTRQEIFIRAKKGEKQFNKIIHQNEINKYINKKINDFKSISKNNKQNNRFKIKF
jgi:hypothetical protein